MNVRFFKKKKRSALEHKQVPNIYGKAEVKWATPKPTAKECELEWAKDPSPKFPLSDAKNGRMGAVLIGYHIDGLNITDARILAEVPQQSEFGEVALKTIQTWKLTKKPAENCLRDHIIPVTFILQ